MVDYAGWEMPLVYTGIAAEHQHTRTAASLFDISHMGRIELSGAGAEDLLQRVCTRQLGDQQVGQSRYSHLCNDMGGIIDDVIVSRFDAHWLMVCNGANRPTVVQWLDQQADGLDVEIKDTTESTLMIALQGPKAIERLEQLLPFTVSDLKRYHFRVGEFMVPYTVFRCGYTGEDGVEIILPAMVGQMIGGLLSSSDGEQILKPAGLGARDTLRLEAGMPLYGHELHTGVDSLSAGLGWCVDLNKEFVGVEALRKIKEQGPTRTLVGLELAGKRIARQHAKVLAGEQEIGEVTSGTLSPTLGTSIAMAYVRPAHAEAGQSLTVEISGKPIDATVVKLPFYKSK